MLDQIIKPDLGCADIQKKAEIIISTEFNNQYNYLSIFTICQ